MGRVYLAFYRVYGGILLLWDMRVVDMVEENVGNYMAACSFHNVDGDYKWFFVGIYGPNLDCNRRFLWEEIAGLSSRWNGPW